MARFPRIISKGGLRKAVFFVHLWFGLFVGLYFSALGLTGSVLVFKEDLESTFVMPERAYVAPPTPEAPLMPVAQILAGLKTQFPKAKEAQLAFFNPPYEPTGAYLMKLPGDDGVHPTTIDPYTGKVIKRYDGGNAFINWCDDFHVNLLCGPQGKIANGWLGFLAGILLVSGIWLWWPATWKQIKIRSTIKSGAPTQRIIADLHNVLGIYPFLALLVITLTGSMIIFYAPIQTVVMERFGSAKIPTPPVVTVPTGKLRLSVDALMKISESVAPNGHYVFVLLPTASAQPFYAYRRSEIGILPDTRIYLDPYTGAVLQVGREKTDPATKRIMRSASGIHFGRWGSFGSKFLYFFLGFIPLGLFVTGVLMYIRRRKSKIASAKRRQAREAAAS